MKPWERMFLIKISIHAPREGGDVVDDAPAMPPQISIHAPREGGDFWGKPWYNKTMEISIHAPREGGDLKPSTQPRQQIKNFNPRPPRGGRRVG